MAERLTEEHVAAIRDAIQPVLDGGLVTPDRLPALAEAVGRVPGLPFSAPELAEMKAAMQLVGVPLVERASWPAPEGSRGLFVVFEGLDRSGKSTQSRQLAKRLEELGGVRWTSFPDRSLLSGALIDLYLRRKLEFPDEAIHMLFCANRWEAAPRILEDLKAGVSVVCDRYAFSGVAYSAAKGLDFEWCKALDIGLPAPDLVFFLRVDPAVGKARANFGDERYENEAMQTAVREEFDRAELHPGVKWLAIDASRTIEAIRDEIWDTVSASRAPVEGPRPPLPPVARLWA